MKMLTAILVYSIIFGFLYLSLPKHPGKLDCASMQETNLIVMMNVPSIECPYGEVQNGYHGLVLINSQYALISTIIFSPLTNPGWSPSIPAWTSPFKDKRLIRDLNKIFFKYDECQAVESALHHQLLKIFEDTYLTPLKNAFMGYLSIALHPSFGY